MSWKVFTFLFGAERFVEFAVVLNFCEMTSSKEVLFVDSLKLCVRCISYYFLVYSHSFIINLLPERRIPPLKPN